MAKNRTELIHCDNCGEDYAATYRRCPFCDAKAGSRSRDDDSYEPPYDDEDDYAPRQGGRRLAGGRKPGRGPGFWLRIALYVVSAAVILAAIWVMCTQLLPRLLPPSGDGGDPSPSPSASPEVPAPASAAPSAHPSALPLPPVEDPAVVTDDPLSLDSPDLPPVETDPVAQTLAPSPAPSASPASSAAPAASAAPGGTLKLSSTDFTLSPRYPTYQLEIDGVGRAQATYAVDNEAVATVSATGVVTAVGNGNTKLTVTAQSGATATAIVRVSGMSGQAASAPASPSPSAAPAGGSASLNYTDFSITAQYPDPVRLRVRDGQAASWSSSNASVASVSGDGTVTGVGNGSAKITCTLSDGSTLTCTVYVSGK